MRPACRTGATASKVGREKSPRPELPMPRQTFDPRQIMKVELEERRDERVSTSRIDTSYMHELMVKMNELEELFTAHKMASSSWRTRAGDFHLDCIHKAGERGPNMTRESMSSNTMEFNGNSALSIRDDHGCSYNTKKSEGLRGRLYEKYMEKRDAKLKEEWGWRRGYKEAKMKSMWDSFEQSQAEMKAWFDGSADAEDLALRRRRHAGKLKSFGACSAIRDTELKLEFIQTEEENPRKQVLYVRYKFFDYTLQSHGSSSSNEPRKKSSSRSASSSISRSSVAPIPTPPVKSGSIRRSTQPENKLARFPSKKENTPAQSVSNNHKHRKENMKTFTGTSKITRSRAHARSLSISEGMNIFKEEKPPRLRSMRDCSVTSGELKDLPSIDTGSANSTLSRFSEERSEQISNRFQNISESKPFLRRGNGISPGAGAFVIHNDEQLQRTRTEGGATGIPSDSDGEKPRSCQESGSSGHPRPDNGDVLELPEGNHGSWNSHINPFSNSHEALDVNASGDAPTSCPDSRNSHPMNQMQKPVSTRARKKWVKTEKIALATTASHQLQNGVAEGFKRLFKFGKKSKGAEGVVNNLMSASTAFDVDNDIENGRDLANQSLDDLRKLRMEYSVAAYHGLNDGKGFPDQVLSLHRSISSHPARSRLGEDHMSRDSLKGHPSLFSLPSFLSKGSESKLR